MRNPHLKLVQTPVPTMSTTPSSDPVRRVFDHWVFMARKSPARAKLGPTRRQAIASALLLYSEAELELAVEGNLVDDWCVQHDRHDIDWLLLGESRIERFIELGERLRRYAAREAAVQQTEAPADPEAKRVAMERLRAMVDQARSGRSLHG